MTKILIEQSGYHLGNMGDVAMLQVAVARLSNFWTDASIKVFTTAPEKLVKYCPNVQPLLPSGRNIWLSPLLGRVHKLMPNKAAHKWSDLECKLRNSSPFLVRSFLQFKLKKRRIQARDFEEFVEAIFDADLVVASGGGYITDVFEVNTALSLATLGLAVKLGKPTVILGHGLGPLQNPYLFTKAKAVLPTVDLITLRERRAGIPLLNSMGVSQARVMTTGDDAIEMAYEARSTELGDGLGINLRIAEYSGISLELLETVRSALQDAARNKGVPLIPVPISHVVDESDIRTIQQLLAGYNDTSNGGQSLSTPLKVIEQIGRCRVVVTGSYHAGVFALAQGIPVVGLAKSKYYIDKFLGLADQFGAGCEVVLLKDMQLREKLLVSIDNAWRATEKLKPQLLESAKQQINSGHAAYKKVYELVKH